MNSRKAASPDIVVIGEALVDILPDGVEKPGGSPANVALTLGRLSRFPRLITSFANDERGRVVRDWLKESGVEVVAAAPSSGRTSTAAVTLDPEGVASYYFDLCWELPPDAASAIDGAHVLHVGSIATVLEPGASDVEAVMRAARDAGIVVTFDPNARPAITPDVAEARARVERLVALSDVVKVSDEDLAWYYPGEAPEDIAKRWAATGPMFVVVTLGGNGALAVQGDELDTVVRVPGVKVDVVDTVGAGDTFMGALIDALTRSYELPEAMRYAAEAAAITCSRAGANPPTRTELARRK